MSEKIVQLNEEVIKGQLKKLVRGSVEVPSRAARRAMINVVLTPSQHLLPAFKNVPIG